MVTLLIDVTILAAFMLNMVCDQAIGQLTAANEKQ